MIDTAVLRTLCEQATPGPWKVRYRQGDDSAGFIEAPPLKAGSRYGIDVLGEDHHDDEGAGYTTERWRADIEFIAAAREALPQLLDENAALREKVTKAEAERDTFSAHVDRVEDENTALESRLAALKEAGEKVVAEADRETDAFIGFRALLRSDPWRPNGLS